MPYSSAVCAWRVLMRQVMRSSPGTPSCSGKSAMTVFVLLTFSASSMPSPFQFLLADTTGVHNLHALRRTNLQKAPRIQAFRYPRIAVESFYVHLFAANPRRRPLEPRENTRRCPLQFTRRRECIHLAVQRL